MKIKGFELKDALGDYDKYENQDRLSVQELSSDAVSWLYNGKLYEIRCRHKLNAILFKDDSLIAVIENLFEKGNKAYIINGENRIIWDVSSIFKLCYTDLKRNRYVVFSDLYLVDGVLNFIVTIGNDDYRFYFNVDNGHIGKLIESR